MTYSGADADPQTGAEADTFMVEVGDHVVTGYELAAETALGFEFRMKDGPAAGGVGDMLTGSIDTKEVDIFERQQNLDESLIEIAEDAIVVRIPYEKLGVKAGDTIRITQVAKFAAAPKEAPDERFHEQKSLTLQQGHARPARYRLVMLDQLSPCGTCPSLSALHRAAQHLATASGR